MLNCYPLRGILTAQQREPGPDDPPGPKYASYDSGPSFGNFGPLPPDDHPAKNPYGSWNVGSCKPEKVYVICYSHLPTARLVRHSQFQTYVTRHSRTNLPKH